MIPPGGGGGKGGPALPQESSDSEHDHQEEPHQIQRIVVDNFLGKLIVNNFEKVKLPYSIISYPEITRNLNLKKLNSIII